jgi:hypothetical protein
LTAEIAEESRRAREDGVAGGTPAGQPARRRRYSEPGGQKCPPHTGISFLEIDVLDIFDGEFEEAGAQATEFFYRIGCEKAEAGLGAAL